jgi:hypothetical protein
MKRRWIIRTNRHQVDTFPQFVFLLDAMAWVELEESSTITWRCVKVGPYRPRIYLGIAASGLFYAIAFDGSGDITEKYPEVAMDAAREYARQVIERLNEG